MIATLSDAVVQQLQDLSGLRIAAYDHEKLNAWMAQRTKKLGLKDTNQFLNYLTRADDLTLERQMLSDLLTTGETFFMRDSAQMELIRREILPQIIKKNSDSKQIKLWAPACATGEEVYSLIILLEKVLPNAQEWKIDVIGSDINPTFIEMAKVGLYKDWAFRECKQEFKDAYFERVDEGWKLINRIQCRARFLVMDLVKGELPDTKLGIFDIDLILCRNLFIYMNLAAISLITDKLSACLRTGGVLMTAHGELHAYRQRKLSVKIFPESLVYVKEDVSANEELLEQLLFTSIKPSMPLSVEMPLTKLNPVPATKIIPIDELLNAAWTFANQAKFNEALEIYKQIIARDSMRADLHYLHAVILLEIGNLEGAKDDLRKALYLDQNFIPAYLDLMTIYIQEGKRPMAVKYCEQALRALDVKPVETFSSTPMSNNPDAVRQYLMNLQISLTSPGV